MDRFQYLALMGGCVLITLPLELLLGAHVYRRPARLVRTLALPVALFLVWDAVAIRRDTWWFSRAYVTGVHAPFSIPIEEVVFFVVVPICALLTYDVVTRFIPKR